MSVEAPPGRAANAALTLLMLEDDNAAALLARLSSSELHRLGQLMREFEAVAPDRIDRAIEDFARSAGSAPPLDRIDEQRIGDMMTKAVGEVKAASLLRRLDPPIKPPVPEPVQLLRWLQPDIVHRIFREEHGQVVAVALLQLDPDVAAVTLTLFPEERRSDIIRRVASLDAVRPAALSLLSEFVADRVKRHFGVADLSIGGLAEAARIINRTAKPISARFVPDIARHDEKLATRLERELFTFEHLFALDAQMMGQLLREIENDVLVAALKGITEPERGVFFAAMSSRAADGLKDEIEQRGRLKRTEVEDAQRQIVGIAKRLEADGTLLFDGGEGDYV